MNICNGGGERRLTLYYRSGRFRAKNLDFLHIGIVKGDAMPKKFADDKGKRIRVEITDQEFKDWFSDTWPKYIAPGGDISFNEAMFLAWEAARQHIQRTMANRLRRAYSHYIT
jgi:hypothetical protein